MKYKNTLYIIGKAWFFDKKYILMTLCLTVFVSIQPFLAVFMPKLIIDELTGQNRSNMLIMLIICSTGALIVVNFAINFIEQRNNCLKIVYGFLRKYTNVNLTTDYANIENAEFLNKSNTARMTIYSVVNSFLPQISSLMSNIFIVLGYAAIIMTLHPLLFIFNVVMAFVLAKFTNHAKSFHYHKQDAISEQERQKDVISGIMKDFSYGKDIRLFNYGPFLINKYNIAKSKRFLLAKEISEKYFFVQSVELLFSFFGEVVSYTYLAYLIWHNQISIGDFIMYSASIAVFYHAIKNSMSSLVDINDNTLRISDLREFLYYEQEEDSALPADQHLSPPYSIEFRNVSFKYEGADNFVMKDFCLTIEQEQRLAIVGVNGAGKTTIVKLLCRLYKPSEGEILLNGINIQSFPKQQYLALISTVFQEIVLFAYSIAENISLQERGEMNIELVNESLRKVGLAEKISSFKQGIHTSLYKILDENGIELSGGESQRVSLARALYKNGGIIILDEPTSALDPLAEYELYKNFNEIVENKTVLYISHRLSSTRFCDKIAYIENGMVAEYGDHNQLMKFDGKYAQMFKVQSQYYQSAGEEYSDEA
ncbi:ABC transporter ATP-binding protein [Paenibacillus sp. FSL R7-0337]|uniref:ABC transporter ATP-binding protein n=1 Tax=Paenibacillus sp. FSL R7-0337 TaxID=1926588 RepID=UPI0009FAED63|nr:ABC transporter ATP-binding protein [Paenibacillus sp. FSL R7-0337]